MPFRISRTRCALAIGTSLLCASLAAQAADIKERTIKFAIQHSAGSAQYDDPQSLIFSGKIRDGATADEQKLLRDAVTEASDHQRPISRERNAAQVAELKAKGMQVDGPAPAELTTMKDKAQPVVDEYTRLLGEPLVKELHAAVDTARAAK